jgi:hypothetical protein
MQRGRGCHPASSTQEMSLRALRATPDEGVRGYMVRVGADAFVRPAREASVNALSREPNSDVSSQF